MADATDDTDASDGSEAGGPSIEQSIKKLTRASNRLSWALIVLVLLVTGFAGFEIQMMQSRLGDMESGVMNRVNRADDDFARIQDQTAAMRGGIELLHQEIGQVRTQMDELNRRLRRRDN